LIEIIDIKNNLRNEDILQILAESIYMPVEERLRNRADKFMLDRNVKAYGAKINGKVCGVVIFSDSNNKQLIILEIAVLSSMQKQGIGRSLINYIIKLFNPETIIAETDDEAVEFYRKIGFEISSLGEKYPNIIRYDCRYIFCK
jgi:ribosomal protein S18 acetylase RimI-like enzyme